MVGAFLIVALSHVPVVEAVGQYRFIFTPIALCPPRTPRIPTPRRPVG
jgi:hypothetical protein